MDENIKSGLAKDVSLFKFIIGYVTHCILVFIMLSYVKCIDYKQ